MKKAVWLVEKSYDISRGNTNEQLLGLSGAWKVSAVQLDLSAKRVCSRYFTTTSRSQWSALSAAKAATIYDDKGTTRNGVTWIRCSLRRFLRCEVPRCKCPEHGVKTTSRALGGGKGSRVHLTVRVVRHRRVAGLLQRESGCKRLMGMQLSTKSTRSSAVTGSPGVWNADRPHRFSDNLGIDEKSFRKGHNYISILTDLDRSRVLDVADGRNESACDKLFEGLTEEQLKGGKSDRYGYVAGLYQSSPVHICPDADIVHDPFSYSANT